MGGTYAKLCSGGLSTIYETGPDHGASTRVRVGLLYPGCAAEGDYAAMAARLEPQVDVRLVHTSVGVDQHSVAALLDLGSAERLAAGAAELAEWDLDVVVWAGTSGSFVFGWEGATAQVRALSDAVGALASSTSFAFVEAVAALGVDTVAVAASYPAEVADRFAGFLATGGIRAVHLGVADIVTAEKVGHLEAADVRALIARNLHPRAEAVLVPDTAMHTAGQLETLEAVAGRPVLTANQVTLWHALRLAGWTGAATELGQLFQQPVPTS